jgi:hypothetical protein
VDVNGVGEGDVALIDDVARMETALEVADEFADDVLDNVEDNETVVVGIYRLVKTVTVVRKRSRTVTSEK